MNAIARPLLSLTSGLVAAELRPWVAEVWAAEVAPADAEWSGVWLPDGAAHLVFRDGRARFFGPATRERTVTLRAAAPTLGVRFQVGSARAFLGMSAAPADLRDSSVAAEERPELAWAADLSQALAQADAQPERFALLEAALRDRRRAALQPCPVVQASVASLADAESTDPISVVARATAGASVRHFHRRFATAVDLSPKQFQRVARFRRCLADALAVPGRSWAGRAVDHGYADQSHLIREFRRLCGLAPGELQRQSTLPAHELLLVSARSDSAPGGGGRP